VLEPGGMVVRPYHEQDVPALVELFARVFGRPITDEHWRWKLAARPAPASNVWLALADGRPVFQYAGIPQSYELEGRAATAFVSVDTMTDPHFRKRGLLTQVAAHAYAAWREAGAAFVIGLPNQQWGSRTNALGWQQLFPLRWMARPLLPHALAARRLRMPWLARLPGVGQIWNAAFDWRLQRDASVATASVTSAGPEFDELWCRLRGRYGFLAVRDSAWVNWRFLGSPLDRYEVIAARRHGTLAGYLAFRFAESGERVNVKLAELWCSPDDRGVFDTLLLELLARARSRRAQLISTLAVPDTWPFHALRRGGFFAGADFSVQMVPLSAAPSADALRARHHWFMSGADFDVI
jgi:hypothetical protein